MQTKPYLSRAKENYLRAIAIVEKRHGHARVRDIANELKVRSPTATQMIQCLAKDGLVDYRPRDFIRLSEAGRETAEKVSARYEVFVRFFRIIGIPEHAAFKDACVLEHHLHNETVAGIRRHVQSLENSRWAALGQK